jgi:RNA polymerase sigma-70 factor (ECF subfamily)
MKPMPDVPTDSIPTRHSLLARMKDWQDQKTWQDFFDTYWKLIYGVSLQSGLTHSESEEVVQETVLSVAKKIGEFKNDPVFGSFKNWLLLITRRRIADQFRKRQPVSQSWPANSHDTNRTSTVERIPDPASLDLDAVWDDRWEKNLLAVAMQNVKKRTSSRQFMLFYQLVVKEWPAGKVMKTFDVNIAQVYMAKYRVGGLVKKELRKLMRQNL